MDELVRRSAELCRRWMPGPREGGARSAWEHPCDLVHLLTEEMPFPMDPEEKARRAVLGWLHDVLEDGVKEDGQKVSARDLSDEGVPEDLVSDVCMLTNTYEDKATYLASFRVAPPRVRLVKVGDRVCNLREGAKTFTARRWIRYVGEALYFVYPLADDLGREGRWLQRELLQACADRPVSK